MTPNPRQVARWEKRVMHAVGPALRLMRLEQGYTQIDVCRMTGLTSSRMSRYESGTTEPSVRSLVKILRALEASFADLDLAVARVLARERPERAPAPPAEETPAERLRPLMVVGIAHVVGSDAELLDLPAQLGRQLEKSVWREATGAEAARRKQARQAARHWWGEEDEDEEGEEAG